MHNTNFSVVRQNSCSLKQNVGARHQESNDGNRIAIIAACGGSRLCLLIRFESDSSSDIDRISTPQIKPFMSYDGYEKALQDWDNIFTQALDTCLQNFTF
jgi:hypothetical protein